MNIVNDPEPISLDTNVVSIIVSPGNPLSQQYQGLLDERTLAVTYFARAELESNNWPVGKRPALDEFLNTCIRLGNPDDATRHWFARAKQVRSRLNLERGVEREDLWIIAQTAEYRLPLLSHDWNAVRVARGLGVDISLTLLDPDRLSRLISQDDLALAKTPLRK